VCACGSSHLGELEGTEGEGDGQHGRHGDGNATDDDDEHVGQRRAQLCASDCRRLEKAAQGLMGIRSCLTGAVRSSRTAGGQLAQGTETTGQNAENGIAALAGRTAVAAYSGAADRLTLAQLAGVLVVAELHGHLDDAPHADGDEAHASDAGHDLLQVGHVVRALRTIMHQLWLQFSIDSLQKDWNAMCS